MILLLFAFDPVGLARIDTAIEAAIKAGQAPGAVVLVSRGGKVAYRKAFGKRSPDEAMTVDTIFDLASLTKPVATASAVMKLVEAGKLRVSDPVHKYIDGFRKEITIEHLLLHTSGLPAGSPVGDFKDGMEKAIQKTRDLSLKGEPGKKFVYSDLGFIALGAIVKKASGNSLDDYCAKELFDPLRLKDTRFRPVKDTFTRVAPTEKGLRGEVHDPRARALGGVAGHAGLFGTADDLSVIAHMLLDGGTGPKGRVLAADTVKLMTTARDVPGGKRAYGWDVATAYSSNRGEYFGGYGHTGFTGTSIWIDPPSRTVVILLTSRLAGKGNVIRLRREVANLVARAIDSPPYPGGREKRVD